MDSLKKLMKIRRRSELFSLMKIDKKTPTQKLREARKSQKKSEKLN